MRDIKGFEGKYAITSCGKVWSYKRQKFLKPFKNNDGYYIIDLGNKARDKRVHRLVAEAYIPNPLGLDTVNHKDECKTNNCVNNLEWMSSTDNIRYGTGSKRSAERRKKSVYCIELNKTWSSLMEAAKDMNRKQSGLCAHLKGYPHCKTFAGYHWRYVETD